MCDPHNSLLTTPQGSRVLFGPDKTWFRVYNSDPSEDRELLCLGKPSCVNLFKLYSPFPTCIRVFAAPSQKETICNHFSISHNCSAPGIQGDRNELWNGLVSVPHLFKSIGLKAFFLSVSDYVWKEWALLPPHRYFLHLWPEEEGGWGSKPVNC